VLTRIIDVSGLEPEVFDNGFVTGGGIQRRIQNGSIISALLLVA
jgi:hypothetical protein